MAARKQPGYKRLNNRTWRTVYKVMASGNQAAFDRLWRRLGFTSMDEMLACVAARLQVAGNTTEEE